MPIYKELCKYSLSLSNVASKSWEKYKKKWEALKTELEISATALESENRNYSEEAIVDILINIWLIDR